MSGGGGLLQGGGRSEERGLRASISSHTSESRVEGGGMGFVSSLSFAKLAPSESYLTNSHIFPNESS